VLRPSLQSIAQWTRDAGGQILIWRGIVASFKGGKLGNSLNRRTDEQGISNIERGETFYAYFPKKQSNLSGDQI